MAITLPTYDQAEADAVRANIQLLAGTGEYSPSGLGIPERGLAEILQAYDQPARLAAADIENQVLTQALLGDVTRAGQGGRYVSGQRFVTSTGAEADQVEQIRSMDDKALWYFQRSPELQQIWETARPVKSDDQTSGAKAGNLKAAGKGKEEFAKWHMNLALKQAGGQNADIPQHLVDLALQTPDIGQYYDPTYTDTADPRAGFLQSEDIESIAKGGEGTIVDRQGGQLSLLSSPETQVRKYDPTTGEVTVGEAGFTEEGEFMGLVPMQEQLQARSDDVRAEAAAHRGITLAPKLTEAMRQGEIAPLLEELGAQRKAGLARTSPLQERLLGEGERLLGEDGGLSQFEERNIRERIGSELLGRGFSLHDRTAGIKVGLGLAEGDKTRHLQNLATTQGLLGGDLGMRQQQFGQTLTELGAQQSTSADPASYAGIATQAPSAGGILGSGAALAASAGPQFINPAQGVQYTQQQSINQAQMQMAQQAADAQKKGGLFSGIAQIAGSALGGGFGDKLAKSLFG